MTIENAPDSLPEAPAKGDFHGKGGELLLIWLGNAALTALTLGVFFAWGKAKLFRFFYGGTEFAGSRFRFTGNGKEIFLGTLKALAVLIPLYGLLAGGYYASGRLNMPALATVSFLAFVSAFMALSQFAIYSTMKYRASRARFREIDFRLEGSAWAFARQAIPRILLGLITLGLAFPLYTHWKISRIYNNLRFGDLRFRWRDDADAYWGLALRGYFLSLLTFGVYYFFWFPKRFAFILDHLSVGDCRFRGTVKPGGFFFLTLTNLLILGCTLGLGAAWVITRSMRFFISRVELENPSRLDWAMQAPRGKVGVTGEAVGDALDLGVGLGF